MGIDSDGDPITSCTVERDHSAIFMKLDPSGKAQKAALKVIKQALSNITNKKMTVGVAVSEIAKTLTTIESNRRNNRARKLLEDLNTSGYLSSGLVDDEGWVWLP